MARRESAARRYAEAAFAVATRDNTVEAWRSELDAAAEIVAVDRIGRTLANPSIPFASRVLTAEATLGHIVGRPVLNLIGLMLRRGRIMELPRLAAEFRALDNRRRGITLATATSSSPISADEQRALVQRLEQFTGGSVELDTAVDPTLLGGLVVRVGDRLMDGSVRSRLERLRNQLVSGAI